jgi:aminomuconate-semialdehyde/2-hydroxymuconate-6-semialdehyde dehydrogenase
METQILNYVAGEFSKSKTDKYLSNENPATNELINQFPDSDPVDMVLAIAAAKKAAIEWAKTPPKTRAEWLNKIADKLAQKKEAFAMAESIDIGKPLWLTTQVDLERAIYNFRFFAAKIMTMEDRAIHTEFSAINYTTRKPVGVVGLILPWNMPLYTLSWKLAPALACGNAVVVKPSEFSPTTAFMLAEIFKELDFPAGVVNVVFGLGEKVGETLVQHPGVAAISFTGGTETGIRIQSLAGPLLKKTSLELGGKNATIILNDANLENCVKETVRSSFLNSGQICICGSRILVQEGIYKEFMEKFRQATDEIVVGDPLDPNSFMGPVVSHQHLKSIRQAIDQAIKEGGKVTAGLQPLNLSPKFSKGAFMRPTIIEDLHHCSDLWQNEIFGPLVTVSSFKYPHEAIKLANTSTYGLAASLWTNDLSRAHKMASELDVGTVWINSWSVRDPRVPFGGVKQSGISREGGEHSLDFYTNSKTICVGGLSG